MFECGVRAMSVRRDSVFQERFRLCAAPALQEVTARVLCPWETFPEVTFDLKMPKMIKLWH